MSSFRLAIERHATARLLAVLLVIVAVALVSVQALDVSWSLAHLKRMTGGVSILDMQFHYSPEEARHLLIALGSEGRAFYLWPELGVTDVLLPLLFFMVLTVAMAISIRGVVDERGWWNRAKWLPLVALLLDYSENGLIAILLLDFPIEQPMLAAIAGWTTTAKHIAYLLCVIVCVGAVVRRSRALA